MRAAARTNSITRNRSAPLIVAGHFTVPCMCTVLTSLFQTYILVDRAPRTVFFVSSCRGRSSPYLQWRFPTKQVTHLLKNARERNEIPSRQNDSCLSNRFAQQKVRFRSARNRRPENTKRSSKRVRSISLNLKYPQTSVFRRTSSTRTAYAMSSADTGDTSTFVQLSILLALDSSPLWILSRREREKEWLCLSPFYFAKYGCFVERTSTRP